MQCRKISEGFFFECLVSGAIKGSLTDFGQRGDKDPESDDEGDLHVVKVDLEDLQADRLLLVALQQVRTTSLATGRPAAVSV